MSSAVGSGVSQSLDAATKVENVTAVIFRQTMKRVFSAWYLGAPPPMGGAGCRQVGDASTMLILIGDTMTARRLEVAVLIEKGTSMLKAPKEPIEVKI